MFSDQISVVIVTHNRVDTLLDTLEKLQSLPENPPLIVVDNGSTDGTANQVCTVFPAVTVLTLPPGLGCVSRNEGIRLAKTPLVALCDDDSYWAPGALTRAIQCFNDYPHLGVLAGRVLLGEEQRLEPVCEAMRDSPISDPRPLPGPAILGFVCCAVIIRQAAFWSIGGFHKQFAIAGEERLFSADMRSKGWSLAYAEDVLAYHFPSPVRSTARRTHLLTRDTLWYYWLRRPWYYALRHTLHIYQKSRVDENVRSGYREAIRQLHRFLFERRPVPHNVEEQLLRIESYY
ncbi:glycosyltransferase family 2 protein [Spirosoma soli]|uniref:Glycosyltransferase family 2 protein n=1 Tax=Spirosoma soli TaxID=1770529 RepID=A0ABW5M787_9BACT